MVQCETGISDFPEVVRTAFRRKNHHHPGGRPETLERMYRGRRSLSAETMTAVSSRPGVAGGAVCTWDAIFDQRESNADIGLLFLVGRPYRSATAAVTSLLLEPAEGHLHSRDSA